MIRSFCGSTMVTLELAEYLSSVGAQVTVYTNVALSPALDSFKKSKIKIISSQEEFNMTLDDFDYIWIHSLTFPKQLLDELKEKPKKLPLFIFLHMSPLAKIPDEHPWIFNFENSLSSLSLYISEGTLESNIKFGLPPKTAFFRNPSPLKFEKVAERKYSKTLRRLLIVSNHPPKEILEAKRILLSKNLRVDVYGEGQDKYEPLSPEVLKRYDAIVTIGKTVQYCIVGSLPVYIYDWYGGPGWLNEDNYEKSKRTNFSGRFFSNKSGKTIAREIVEGYSSALSFQLNYLTKQKDEFLLDTVLKELFCDLQSRKLEPLEDKYIESAKAAVACAEIRFISSEELGRAYIYCNDLKRERDDCRKQLEECNEQIRRLTEEKKQLEGAVNSKRFKILNRVLGPHDKIKDYFKRTK